MAASVQENQGFSKRLHERWAHDPRARLSREGDGTLILNPEKCDGFRVKVFVDIDCVMVFGDHHWQRTFSLEEPKEAFDFIEMLFSPSCRLLVKFVGSRSVSASIQQKTPDGWNRVAGGRVIPLFYPFWRSRTVRYFENTIG